MATVTFNGITIAQSDETVQVEGNHYFPPQAILNEYFKASELQTTCGWKGVASYYHIDVDGTMAENAAWYYPAPKEAANNIENYVAFYRNHVTITD